MVHGILCGMERRRRHQRTFLGPIEIAGFFAGLEAGYREIGASADLHDVSGDPFHYRRIAGSSRRTAEGRQGAVGKLLGRLYRGIARAVLFVWALARYDTFVIGGTGFWSGRELPILKALGKRVIWVFLGTDHRPPYLNGKFVSHGLRSSDLGAKTRSTSARVGRVERWADAVIAHEASAQFHRRPFVRLLEIGLPTLTEQAIPSRRPDPVRSERVRILHCPTDPLAKASARIRAIVDDLRSSGLSVEYREVVDRPHEEVIEAISESDLVIDELYGDTPLGVLATEAAWLGKPTICGGYFAGDECRPLADGSRFPEGFVSPDALPDVARRLAEKGEERSRLGKSAAEFVRSRWTHAMVAARVRAVASGTVPAEWMVDPGTIVYVDGYGLARSDRVAAVTRFVDQEGQEALALPHRPDLVRALTQP